MKDEDILWQASGADRRAERFVWPRGLRRFSISPLKILSAAFMMWFIYGFFRDLSEVADKGEFLRDAFAPLIIFVVLIGSYVAIIKKLKRMQEGQDVKNRRPHWLSRQRLSFMRDLDDQVSYLDVKDILSIAPDYSEGSPSIRIQTRDEYFSFVSADRDNLISHLYALRPELEPSR